MNQFLIGNRLETNGYGIVLGTTSDNTVRNNTAIRNGYTGIYREGSTGNQVIDNTVTSNGNIGISIHTGSNNGFNGNISCSNGNLDFYIYRSTSSGANNACDRPGEWNDPGTAGCSHTCSRRIFLPVILKD